METIDQAYVNQFTSDVIHLSQQKKSKFRNAVMNGSQKGEQKFYERVGAATATKKVARHGDTPISEVEHSRRAVTLEDYEFNKLFDKEDDEKVLIDANNAYTQAGARAMARAIDDEIIAALVGNSYSGKGGTVAVALPITQKLLAQSDSALGTPTKLNVDTLVKIKGLFLTNEVDEEDEEFFISVPSRQLQAMLRETEVTSADYAQVKALVEGKIDTYMGFKWINSQRLGTTSMRYNASGAIVSSGGTLLSNADRIIAWAKSGAVLSVARDVTSRVDERADKSYAKQVYFSMGIGAARLEEEKVVEVACATS